MKNLIKPLDLVNINGFTNIKMENYHVFNVLDNYSRDNLLNKILPIGFRYAKLLTYPPVSNIDGLLMEIYYSVLQL